MAYASFTQSNYPQQIVYNNTAYPALIIYNDIFARGIAISEMLPFRVRFNNVGIDPNPYGPGNPAPIGIAVIGANNYIL